MPATTQTGPRQANKTGKRPNGPAQDARPAVWDILAPLLLLAVTFLVYANAVSCGFIYDDNVQILSNPQIRSLRFIPHVFSGSVWDFQKDLVATGSQLSSYYRPIANVFWMITYAVFGLQASGFHLVNLLLHAGVVLLTFAVGRSILARDPLLTPEHSTLAALCVALLFATHPAHTEAVTWVSALPHLACSFFYLLSFHLYVTSRGVRTVGYIASVLAFWLSLLCYEPAVTLPLLLVAYDYVFEADRSLRHAAQRYVGYLTGLGFYLLLRRHAVGASVPIGSGSGLTLSEHCATVAIFFWRYVKTVMFPLHLQFWYEFVPERLPLSLAAIASLAACVAFLFCAALVAKRKHPAFLGLAFFVVPLLPAFNVFSVEGQSPFAERYVYLPSFGFTLLIGMLCAHGVRKNSVGTLAIVAVLAGICSVATVRRNRVYTDEYTFWTDTVNKSPNSAVPRVSLSNALLAAGQTEAAVAQLEIAMRLAPGRWDVYYNLGSIYASRGLFRQAIEYYRMSVAVSPDAVMARYSLGIALMDFGDFRQAAQELAAVVRAQPNYPDARRMLQLAYTKLGALP